MTKINCFAVILLLLQWIELGQGTFKEEWELSSLERVWLEIFWRVNSAAAEARVLRFLSFIHWAGRRRGRRGRSRSPFIISGTLSGECSLQQPSSAHRMINLQTIGKDRLVIDQPWLSFEQSSSSSNVYHRKILFYREWNSWYQIVKYIQLIYHAIVWLWTMKTTVLGLT